ncbi:MAG: PLDc N-terminal domain-containing protein, partial [Muribaculaceae bacterium]|nr:PLDc N-terminal domain-containing protein [Muribaculaceae bacterium]
MIESLGNVLTSGWLYSTLLWIAVGSTVIIIGVILSENRNPVKSLAWVTILLLLPVAGIVLYFFFGRNIKNKRMISRRERRRLRRRERRVKA